MAGLLIGALAAAVLEGPPPTTTPLFSNDGPLGRISARYADLPSGFRRLAGPELGWAAQQPSGMPSIGIIFHTVSCLIFIWRQAI